MKKRAALVLIIFATLLACKNRHADSQPSKNDNVKISSETRLKNWLKEYNIEKSYFKDSSKRKSFELWAYSNPLDGNSDELREYSIDSSFRLVSNFYRKNSLYKVDSLSGIFFSFLPKDKSEYYIGIQFLNYHPNKKVTTRLLDYKWLDEDEFGILNKSFDEAKPKFYLTKLKIETDTIWEYNPE